MKISFFHLPENTSPQTRNALRINLIGLLASIIAASFYLYLALQFDAWQLYAWSIDIWVLALSISISTALIRRNRIVLGIWVLLAAIQATFIGAVALIEGIGLILGVSITILVSIIAGQTLPSKTASRAIILGIASGVAAILLEQFLPAYRYPEPEQVRVFLPAILGVVILLFGYVTVQQFRNYALRTKFLIGILSTTGLALMVFVVFAVSSLGQTRTFMIGQLQSAVRSQSRLQLGEVTSAASLDAEEIFSEMVEEVAKLAEYQSALYAQSPTLEQGAYWDAATRLYQRSGGQYGSPTSDIASVFVPSIVTLDEAVIANINTGIYLDFTAPTILQSNPNIVAIYFIGTDGSTIYYPNINLAEVVPPDFDPRLRPFYSIATPQENPERKVVWTDPYQDAAGNGLMVTSAAPVYDQKDRFRGVVAVDVQLAAISRNVSEIEIGESGFAFMVDASGRLIGMPEAGYLWFNLTPEVVPVDETPTQTILGVGTVELQEISQRMIAGETGLEVVTIQDEQYYVSYAPLSSLGYSLGVVAPVAELDALYLTARDQIEKGAENTTRVATIILIVIFLAAGGASLLLSQILSGPIVRLTRVAEQVTEGDLGARAKIESTDETGTLAGAFNRMTTQLREMIGTLEQRVADRTRNLVLAADVGRTISQVRALNLMLRDACELILKEFNLYYVQVYLTDPSNAVLRLEAGTGSVGAQLIGRRHSLPLDSRSINGRSVVEKRSVVIPDTSKNPTFRPNALLPETRGEMAVPLIVADKVVGVLDMQSSQPDVLTEEVLPAFEALAGQLAVAIQNANLLAETEQARAQVEAQARRLVREGWREHLDAIHKPERVGYVFDHNAIVPLASMDESEWTKDTLAISAPIAVTGESLGSLTVELTDEARREFTSELVDIVARQVAQQVENLRLLESAERYRLEAEEASRRLTREGWKGYADRADQSLGYYYDMKEVRPLDGNTSTESAAITPLKVREEVIGKLAVQDLNTGDQESFELVNAVAERLSAHIENLRLFDETHQSQLKLENRARQLESVAEISTIASREVNLQRMLEAVVHLTQRRFGLYHAHIFTFDEDAQRLDIAACGWKEGDEHEGTHGTAKIPLQQEQSLVARAGRTLKPVIVNNVQNDPGWLPNPLLPDTASEMAIPLVVGDQLLGVLDVQSDQFNAFTEEDANIQTTLASQVATSMQNARTFAQAQKQAERESMLNVINQKIQSATSVDAVLQIAARELGHALGAPMTVAQLTMKDSSS